VAGYFLEAAMVHYLMTNRTDSASMTRPSACRLLGRNLDRPETTVVDGHEGHGTALTRFARFVTKRRSRAGDPYAALAKFLLDSRGSGGDPRQLRSSHTRPLNQTSAVGHAVRATYLYSAMADVHDDRQPRLSARLPTPYGTARPSR